jgi:hypothetical protein
VVRATARRPRTRAVVRKQSEGGRRHSEQDCAIDPFAALQPGDELAPFTLTISEAANDRYWHGAGVDHPLRRAGALYPLIAANLTVLTFQQRVPAAMIQTRQRLVCHRRAGAPASLVTHATVHDRFEKRGLPYVTLRAEITSDESPLWTSTVDFTPAAAVGARR